MDIDGVDAQVLYPNLGIGPIFLLDDTELQFACLRAYNDFLSEFCSTDVNRLVGIGLIPTDDVKTGVEEIKHCSKLKGLRGVMLPTYPRGEPLNSSTYEPLWQTAEDLGLPVHIHLRTGARHAGSLFGNSVIWLARNARCSISHRWRTTKPCRGSSSGASWSAIRS